LLLLVDFGQQKLSLFRAQFESPGSEPVPVLLGFLTAEGKSISSHWYLVKGAKSARSSKEADGKHLNLNSTFTIPDQPKGSYVGEQSVTRPAKATGLVILVPSQAKGSVYINLATR